MHFERCGVGQPILLVHGYGGSSQSWKQVKPFLASSAELTSVDLVGFGASNPPRDFDYSLSSQARYLAGFVDTNFATPPTIVAHSMGAAIVAIAILDFKLEAKSLIIVNGMLYPFPSPRIPSFLAALALAPIIHRFFPPRLQVKYVLGRMFHNRTLVTPEIIGRYAQEFNSDYYRRTLRRTGVQLSWTRSQKYTAKYNNLHDQVHIIWGRNDPLITENHARHIAKKMSARSIQLLDECGHLPHEERPEQFAQAVIASMK